MTIPPCPHCNSSETCVTAQAHGPALYYFDDCGDFIEMDYDRLRFKKSHVIRCTDCFKIRRDLKSAEGRVVIKDIT